MTDTDRSAPPATIALPRRRWRLGRLLSYIVTLWFLVTLNFVLPRAMPGDPIKAMLATGGSPVGLDADQVAAAIRYYGLDRPLWEQYTHYLGGLAGGDLGVSIRQQRPVAELVAGRLPWTLLLAGTAVALATGVGLAAGVHAAWRRGGAGDRGLLTLFTALRGVPPFFLASLLLFVFAVKLGWFPLGGAVTPSATPSSLVATVADVAWHLVLPAATAAVLFAAGPFLITRAGMVSELGADYLLLGRAKGLSERRLKYRYAARNALLPLVTITALELAALASAGLIFVEAVFAYPGMGQLLFEAVTFRDYPTMQGCFLVISLAVVSVNLVADIVYARLDPRTTA